MMVPDTRVPLTGRPCHGGVTAAVGCRAMDDTLRARAEAAKGFMPADEGVALHDAAAEGATALPGAPLLEVGTYCGKSAIYLGAAARAAAVPTTVFTVDHHRGSEENQAGWAHHDASLIDPESGRIDTLPTFRRTIAAAGLEDVVVAVIGESTTVARHWTTPLAFSVHRRRTRLGGGVGRLPGWTPKLAAGGTLGHPRRVPRPGRRRPGARTSCTATAARDSGPPMERTRGCGSLRRPAPKIVRRDHRSGSARPARVRSRRAGSGSPSEAS